MDMLVGEAFGGEGGNTAHIKVLAGPRSGPLGTAFATALTNPKPGIVPFLAVLQPNAPVVPATLIVNKAAIESGRHGTLTWGAM
jgi:5,6,7,8-tetrahydromethanopterin hydro-lyase